MPFEFIHNQIICTHTGKTIVLTTIREGLPLDGRLPENIMERYSCGSSCREPHCKAITSNGKKLWEPE